DPGHPIEAKVTRTAQGLDARTRTMLVEVDVPNEPVRLYPGSYVNVKIRFPGRRTPLVPGDALAWRGDIVYVARLDAANRVKFVRIQPGEDNGRQVQVLSGLEGGSRSCSTPAPSSPTETGYSHSLPRTEAGQPGADGTHRAARSPSGLEQQHFHWMNERPSLVEFNSSRGSHGCCTGLLSSS